MLSSHLVFCLPCLLPPFTVTCKMTLDRSDERETCPYNFSLRLFTMIRSSRGPIACWTRSYEKRSILWEPFISMARILLRRSAVRVHDSQAKRKVDVTRESTSRILELREMLLSFQTGFNLVSAAVVCAILESISGLEPSSVKTEPRYLKLVTVPSFCLLSPWWRR